MQLASVVRIEKNMDRAASALFAAAVAYAAYCWFAPHSAAVLWAETIAIAGCAYLPCVKLLNAVEAEVRKVEVPIFDLRQIEPVEIRPVAAPQLLLTHQVQSAPASEAFPELLLTERHEPVAIVSIAEPEDFAPTAEDEMLILDDVLAELEPDSRVVRLFDRAAMPTPGQLNDRIERHFDRSAPTGEALDASEALHEALAQLRRSLG